MQEVFIKLWDRRSLLDPDKSISAYLYTIAHNLIKDLQKAYAREYPFHHSEALEADLSYNNVLEQLSFKEMKSLEESVVNKLPAQQKEAYRLSRYEDYSYQEIADEMGISINSVKTHLRLALKTLKNNLEPVSNTLIMIISLWL